MSDGSELPVGGLKQIYTGTKSYWRSRTTVDITIFEHFAPSTANSPKKHWVEVVCYNPTKNCEAPHLYLESDRLCERFKAKAKSSNADLFSLQEEVVPGQKYAQVRKYVRHICSFH